jgi:hypothetical protein
VSKVLNPTENLKETQQKEDCWTVPWVGDEQNPDFRIFPGQTAQDLWQMKRKEKKGIQGATVD